MSSVNKWAVEKHAYRNKTKVHQTLQMGEITPVFWRRYYPGDKINNLSFQNLTRMITPLFATMENPNIKLYAFWTPDRILTDMNNIKKGTQYFREGKQYTLDLTPATLQGLQDNSRFTSFIPNIEINPDYKVRGTHIFGNNVRYQGDANFQLKGLFQKMGIDWLIYGNGTNEAAKDVKQYYKTPERIKINSILAYHAIYDAYFRNKEIEDAYLPIYLPEWCKQFNTTNNTFGYNLGYTSYKELPDGGARGNSLSFLNSLALAPQEHPLLESLRFTKLEYGAPITGFEQMLKQHAKFISLNRITAGQDYKGTAHDLALRIWNENNGALTDPMLIGYHKWEQGIHQITNTANSTTDDGQSYTGDVAGQSSSYNEGTLIRDFDVKEHGTLMVVAVANYPAAYRKYYDYFEWDAEAGEFEPGLEEFPDVELYNKQFGIKNNPNISPKKLGYLKNWDNLRNTNDLVLGGFRNAYSQWIYSSDNPLNPDTQEIDAHSLKVNKEPFLETLTPAEDSFLMEFNFFTEELRSIKPYADAIEALTEPIAE